MIIATSLNVAFFAPIGRETRKGIMKVLCKNGADGSAVDDYGYSLLEIPSSMQRW